MVCRHCLAVAAVHAARLQSICICPRRILDGVHCGLITAALYGYCITNFLNLAAVQKPVWCVLVALLHPFTVPTHPFSGPSL